MKITFFASVFFIAFLFVAQTLKAQTNDQGFKDKTPAQRAQVQTTMMKNKLSLDSAQTLKIQDINLKYAQQIDPVLKSDGRKLSKLRQMKSILGQKDKDMKAVLNANQYKQWKEMEAEMKEKMKESRSQ